MGIITAMYQYVIPVTDRRGDELLITWTETLGQPIPPKSPQWLLRKAMPANTKLRWVFYPSGKQILLTHGNIRAVVTQVGATLRLLEMDERPILWGFDESESSSGGRGQVLAPWPNRLQDGHYNYSGITGVAALDDHQRSCAIHGLVRWVPWEIQEMNSKSVRLKYWLAPQPAYPFSLHLSITYSLSDEGLTVEYIAHNGGPDTLPFGIGFHPYLAIKSGDVDQARLQIPANRRLILDDRGLPRGIEPVADTPYDFRSGPGWTAYQPRSIRDLQGSVLDDCFTDLTSRDDRKWRVLFQPDERSDSAIVLWGESIFRYVMCYTGDTLKENIRRKAVAIEPMTCPPNALRTGDDLILIKPGEQSTGSWGIEPLRYPD